MVEGPAPLDEPLGLAHEPVSPEATLASAALPRYSLKNRVLDLRHRRLVDLLVDADGRQRREEIWVNVRVREVARAREELLDIGLVRRRALNLCLAAHVDFRRGDCLIKN